MTNTTLDTAKAKVLKCWSSARCLKNEPRSWSVHSAPDAGLANQLLGSGSSPAKAWQNVVDKWRL